MQEDVSAAARKYSRGYPAGMRGGGGVAASDSGNDDGVGHKLREKMFS